MVNTVSTAKDQQSQETRRQCDNVSPSCLSVMSAPLFFQSAERGHRKFWAGVGGPTVVVWESLLESEQTQWLEKMSRLKDCVVWCRSKEKDEEQRHFEVNGNEIFSDRSMQAKVKVGEKTNKRASGFFQADLSHTSK